MDWIVEAFLEKITYNILTDSALLVLSKIYAILLQKQIGFEMHQKWDFASFYHPCKNMINLTRFCLCIASFHIDKIVYFSLACTAAGLINCYCQKSKIPLDLISLFVHRKEQRTIKMNRRPAGDVFHTPFPPSLKTHDRFISRSHCHTIFRISQIHNTLPLN